MTQTTSRCSTSCPCHGHGLDLTPGSVEHVCTDLCSGRSRSALTIRARWTPEGDRSAVSVWNGSVIVADAHLAHEKGRLTVVADDGRRFRPLAPVEPCGLRTPVEAVA